MKETWLKTNRRILMAFMVLASIMIATGFFLLDFGTQHEFGIWPDVLGWLAVVAGALFIALLAFFVQQPRIGYRDGNLLFFLRHGPPIAVPIEIVEAFFLGQGDTHLSGKAGRAQTINLVARIGERFSEWQQVDVISQLGSWCDGYVIIRGTWTEPLTEELARAINHKLGQAKRADSATDTATDLVDR